MPEDNLSSLERVRQRLYSNTPLDDGAENSLSQRTVTPSKGWDKLKAAQVLQVEAHHMSGPARFFVAAALLFFLTASGAIIYIFYGGRAVSTTNVSLQTQGPTTVASGDTVPVLVTIDNKNPVILRGATLTVTFPEGTRSPENPETPLPNLVEELGDIPAGGHVERTIRATVFGSEQQALAFPMKLQYKTDSSSAVFVKQKIYDFVVSTSPVTLSISSLSQASSGQSLDVDVLVTSSATKPLENVAVQGEYPFGFVVSSTDPKPASGTLFYIGKLSPGEQKHIRVTGVINGENQDQRIFRFTAGTLATATSRALATTYTVKEADVTVTKPFLSTTLVINNDSGESPVIPAGVSTQATVTWVNNLSVPVTNAQVTVVLSGEALDATSVRSGNGFYRSSDTTVVFNSQTAPGLARLAPRDTGQGTFTFVTKKGSALNALRNPSVTMKVSIAGERNDTSNVPGTVTSTLTRTIKVATNLSFTSRAVRTIGGIPNTGPWPPVADKETTYTVQYTLTNNLNSVAGAKVSAVLPTNVRYTGVSVPSDGSVSFDASTRTVTWNAGDIASGSQTPKTISYQVALTPSIADQGNAVPLVTSQKVTATDRFTGNAITGTVTDITTDITADPAFTPDKGKVK